jgi:hypothetical protein
MDMNALLPRLLSFRVFRRPPLLTILLTVVNIQALCIFNSVFRGYRRALPGHIEDVRTGKEPLIPDSDIPASEDPIRDVFESTKGKNLWAAWALLLLVHGNPIAARVLVIEYLTEHLQRKSWTRRRLREYFIENYSQLAEIETLSNTRRKILRDFADELRNL